MSFVAFLDALSDDLKICIFELVLTGLNSYIIYTVSKVCNKKETILKALQEAPSLTCGKEMDEFMKLNDKESLSYAVIRGKVSPYKNNVISASLNGVKSVYKITNYQDMFSKFGWNGKRYDYFGKIYETHEFFPFSLVNVSVGALSMWPIQLTSDGESYLIVNDIITPVTENILQTLPTVFEPKADKYTWFNGILDYVLGLSTLVGTHYTERLLPVNEMLTAVGRIVKRDDGHYVLTAPCDPHALYLLTTRPIGDIVEEYSVQVTALGFAVCIMTIGGIWLLFDVIKRTKKSLLAATGRAPDDNMEADLDDPLDENIPDEIVCVICQNRRRNVVFFPCRHFCACRQCARLLQTNCPTCRRNIETIEKVFVV